MGNITGASLAPIYERINGTANYHPYDAETFSDWSLEAGDLVKVVRGDENYKSPIHSSSLVWTGSPNMTLTSTGNQAREAVAKVSKKKYARSGYGRRNNKQNNGMWHTIEETDEYYRIIYADEFNGLRSSIEQTASYWRATLDDNVNNLHSQIEQTASYWRATLDDNVNNLHSQIEQTASYWRSTLEDTANSLHTEIEQTASGWRTALSGVMSNGRVTAASIATAINEQGQAGVRLSGDWIEIDGNTTINDVFTVGNRTVQVKLPMRVEGDIMAESITLRTHGGNGVKIDEDDITNMIISASVSGNVLTLTPLTGSAITFSKATSLSGEWSGDNTGITATITVTATPQDESFSSHVNLHINQNAAWITDPAGTIRARLSNTPYSNVSITYIGLASNYSALSDSETRTSIYIEADASNGAVKNDELMTLAVTTYSGGSKRCVNLVDGSDIIGRVNIDSVYNAGYSAAHLSGTWDKTRSTLSRDNRITIEKVTTGSTNSLNYVISAAASLSWNGTSRKYTATGQAKVDGTVRGDNATAVSGALSIVFNDLSGTGSARKRTVSVYEGQTSRFTSGNLTDYGDGYAAGWNAVGGDQVSLGSSSSSSGTITKGVSSFSGYVWIKNVSGSWVRKRTFSISTEATHYTVPLYYLSGGTYSKISSNKLVYYT